jgi:hypothetical protein
LFVTNPICEGPLFPVEGFELQQALSSNKQFQAQLAAQQQIIQQQQAALAAQQTHQSAPAGTQPIGTISLCILPIWDGSKDKDAETMLCLLESALEANGALSIKILYKREPGRYTQPFFCSAALTMRKHGNS